MKSESFLHPLHTRCKNKRRHAVYYSSTPIQPTTPFDLAIPSNTHTKPRRPLNNNKVSSPSDTHAKIKTHLHRLIHSSKATHHYSHSHSHSYNSESTSSSSSEDEYTVPRQNRQSPQLVYEHELIDGVVNDAECGEVCIVLEVGVARVVGVEWRGWWEVGIVHLGLVLNLSAVEGDERKVREEEKKKEEEIGKAF